MISISKYYETFELNGVTHYVLHVNDETESCMVTTNKKAFDARAKYDAIGFDVCFNPVWVPQHLALIHGDMASAYLAVVA